MYIFAFPSLKLQSGIITPSIFSISSHKFLHFETYQSSPLHIAIGASLCIDPVKYQFSLHHASA